MKLYPSLILKNCRVLLILILIPSIVLLSSCAVLYNGSNQLIPVSSAPLGAEVFVNGELIGITPLEIDLARANSHTILLRLGELEREVIITNTLNGGMVALDIVPGAIMLTLLLLPTAKSDSENSLSSAADWGFDFSGIVTAIVIGGVVVGATPVVVDAATGAWYELSPGEVFVDFEKP